MNESLPLSAIHQVILRFLRERTDVALFGAQAVNAYVEEYRMTQDVDLMATEAEAFAEAICGHLHGELKIAVRTRTVASGKGFRIFQLRKPSNRHLIDVRQVDQLPQCRLNDGIRVVEPFELIALKTISMTARRNTPKGFTDQADLMRLLIAFPQYRTEQDLVIDAIRRHTSDPSVLQTWRGFISQDYQADDDDQY